ncbi:hypothetical protein IM538_03885 [Cytobacillus suaedae]|nr:hypothetical protein IM538_03885 [Cytobacillus suaedae]
MKSQFKVKSISYVHDPEATGLWTKEIIESMKREILDSVSKTHPIEHINNKEG